MRTGNDLHNSLRSEVIGSAGQAVIVKLQWGKNDVGYSLHVSPNSFSMSGLQVTDLLSFLGFERTACPFQYGSGYCTWIDEGFDIQGFGDALGRSYTALREAQRHLEACGLVLPQPEGWAHFAGKPSSRTRDRFYDHVSDDGHTSPKTQRMKIAEDESFAYVHTWIEGGSDKGWVTHYRPKHPPLSVEVQAAFDLLGLHSFENCPEFDFESCHWRFIEFKPNDYMLLDFAHRSFEANQTNFTPGIEKLLAAHSILEPFGMKLLPIHKTVRQRVEDQLIQQTARSEQKTNLSPTDRFDVALSFAGTNRAQAEKIAQAVRDAGYSVFYDHFYPEELWGKDLVVLFDEIYRKRSRYCVIFVSQDYVTREWTNHERRSAQARALKEKGAEYILPIKIDDVDLPGMPPTIGYLSLSEYPIDKIAKLLIKKLAL